MSVALDIDPFEEASLLAQHSERNGFEWSYAIAPQEASRAIADELGPSFLNPPSAPMVLVRPDNSVVPFPFGVKSAEELAELVESNRLN